MDAFCGRQPRHYTRRLGEAIICSEPNGLDPKDSFFALYFQVVRLCWEVLCRGLHSARGALAQSSPTCEPMRNVATSFPAWRVFLVPVITPDLMRGNTPSENISEWTPRCCDRTGKKETNTGQ